MSEIVFDIETIPSQRPGAYEEVLKTIRYPGSISKPATIARWYAENLETAAQEKYRKQALDGLYGEIISIAWAIDDREPDVVFRSDENEAGLLASFFEKIVDITDKHGQRDPITRWVGHYITGFDLRFLWQRCVINKVKPLLKIPHNAKPWDASIFDTKIEWTGAGQNVGAGSMDAICKSLGIPGKTDMDGSMVYDYWLAGRYEEIAEYNMRDVIATREIYRRMNFLE